jgi:large subunit ribosomal protein L30
MANARKLDGKQKEESVKLNNRVGVVKGTKKVSSPKSDSSRVTSSKVGTNERSSNLKSESNNIIPVIKKSKQEVGDKRLIKIRQLVSGYGKGDKYMGTLIGLGLNKINKTSVLSDTPAIRGMINKVSHLIKIID